MRYKLKMIAVWIAHMITWPLATSASLVHRSFASESVFDFFAKMLSLLPGRIGSYFRTSYYVQTLPRCGYDFNIGFGSFISHINAEIGQGVGVGSFCIIGTCTIGDDVMIGSRVSVLSGKYQHGGGARGRDFKRNEVRYERVHIGDGSWLGEGCIVMCDVGRNAIVSAGSVVTKSIPDGVTAIGNPARYLRYEHDAVQKRQLLAAGAVLVTGLMCAVPGTANAGERDIVLVGASIGRAWQVPGLPGRAGLHELRMEYIGVPDTFDKGAAIAALVARPRKPDVVIIKECSTYFPGDVGEYRRKVRTWVETLHRAGIVPALATTVPVAKPESGVAMVKAWIRTNLFGGDRKMEQLLAYNDWVRRYAAQEHLPLLDLERALRISETDRALRREFATADRVHLNDDAYRALDALMTEFVASLQAGPGPRAEAIAGRAQSLP